MKILIFVFVITVLLYSCDSDTYNNVVMYDEMQIKVIDSVSVSAYTASIEECGKDDGIGAYNIEVWPGTIACNFLPKGALVRIPEIFGDKIFIALDKMAVKNFNNVDVFVNEKTIATHQIGRKSCSIEIVGEIKLNKKILASN